MRTAIRRVLAALVIALPAAAVCFGASIAPVPRSASPATAPPPCDFTDIDLNTEVSDALTTSDCPLSGTYADYYRFIAPAGTNVTVTLRAPALGDVLLSIQDAGTGTILARDNEVSFASTQLKIPADGFYFIRIWSTDPTIPTGAYKLRVSGLKPTNGCSAVTDPTVLCMGLDRFQAKVTWSAVHQGTQGKGTAISLTDDTGSFWFFSSNNVELVVKVLDGLAINGHFWVFYGALTNVQYTITITDTLNGTVKTYTSPQDTQASVSDTTAF